MKRPIKTDIGILLNGGRGNMSISWGPAYEYYALLLKRLKWIKLFQELNQYSKNVGGARFRRLKKISQIAFPFIEKINSSGEKYHFPPIN